MTLIDRIKSLRIGKSFNVTTESERVQALNIAKTLGRRIVTKGRKSGGFTIMRMPE